MISKTLFFTNFYQPMPNITKSVPSRVSALPRLRSVGERSVHWLEPLLIRRLRSSRRKGRTQSGFGAGQLVMLTCALLIFLSLFALLAS